MESPARCLKCFYVIEGLPECRCPECGQEFDPDNPETYTFRPPFIRWKFWFPGVSLAITFGMIANIILLQTGIGIGWSITCAVPISVGIILGYRCRTAYATAIVLSIASSLVIVGGLITLQFVGFFCGLIAAVTSLLPLFLGLLFGYLLKITLKVTNFEQRGYLPLLAIFIFPFAIAGIESMVHRQAIIVSAKTSRVIKAYPCELWAGLKYYDELESPPPLLFKLGLPRPLSTDSKLALPGDVQTCIYDKGHVTKQLKTMLPESRLAFIVTEQDIGFDQSVRLIGGSFDLTALADGYALLTLTTEYEALLRPRFCWSPFERLSIRTLHNYILDEIEHDLISPPMLASRGGVR